MIEWILYDSKFPESHVPYLVSNGIWVAIAVHQLDVKDRIYTWYIGDGKNLDGVTYFAKINYPES